MIDNYCYRTDMFFLREDGIIKEFPEYYLVKSPLNPSFYFGNYLLLKDAPKSDQRVELQQLFDKNFADLEEAKHYNFCWAEPAKLDYTEYINAGYEYGICLSLVAVESDLIAPEKINEAVQIRAFEKEADWQQFIDLEIAYREKSSTEEGYRIYIERKKEAYVRMINQGRGDFYGAFVGEELVAYAGMIFENGVGRYQMVVTKENYRRKGICSTLVYFIADKYFKSLAYLVIVADQDYHALDLYKKLGFREKDYQVSLCLANRNTLNK